MAKQTLQGFSQDELARGIFLSLNNAEDLKKEGDLLSDNGMIPRAYTLYQLALEETGKCGFLIDLLFLLEIGIEISWEKVNDEFMSHKVKTKAAIDFEISDLIPCLFQEKKNKKAKVWQDLKDLTQQQGNVHISNKVKNDSLYVGIAENKFISPNEIITKDLTDNLKANLIVRLELAKKTSDDFANHFYDDFIDEIKEVVVNNHLQNILVNPKK